MSFSRRANQTVLLLVLLVAFALRIHRLEEQSLWYDEVYTWKYTQTWPNPLAVEARMFVYLGFVTPFAAILPGELGLRLASLLAGVVAVAVIFQVGKEYHTKNTGLVAALLLAVSPYALYFSQEARSYALVMLAALVTLWMIPLIEKRVRWAPLAYETTTAILAGMHLLSVPWILVQLIFLYIRRRITLKGPPESLLRRVVVEVSFVVFVVFSMGVVGFYGFIEGLGWIRVPTVLHALGNFVAFSFGFMRARDPSTDLVRGLSLIIMFLMMIIAWRSKEQPRRFAAKEVDTWMLGLLIVLAFMPPLLILFVTYTIKPLWAFRYFMPSIASLILLNATTLNLLRSRKVAWTAVALLLLCSIVLASKSYDLREDWKGATKYLIERHDLTSQDLVLVCPNRQLETVQYYLPNTATILSSQGTLQEAEQIQDLLAKNGRLFFLSSGCPTAHDGWPDIGIVDDSKDEKVSFPRVFLYIYK